MSDQILVELQESMGSDRSIANAAWTSSFDKNRRDARTDQQVSDLVQRLASEGHATPFESVVLRFWIRHPIFVDRQHMTHRIASHNGLSGRYRTMPLDYFHIPDDVITILDRVDGFDRMANPDFPHTSTSGRYYESCEVAVSNYSHAIDAMKKAEKHGAITNKEFKRAREILRGQLPTAGMVERTTIMNLRSFANYQKLRNSDHAQPEIKRVAELKLQRVLEANICPAAIEALMKNGWQI
jgi:thymidylate synthase (FAD)